MDFGVSPTASATRFSRESPHTEGGPRPATTALSSLLFSEKSIDTGAASGLVSLTLFSRQLVPGWERASAIQVEKAKSLFISVCERFTRCERGFSNIEPGLNYISLEYTTDSAY